MGEDERMQEQQRGHKLKSNDLEHQQIPMNQPCILTLEFFTHFGLTKGAPSLDLSKLHEQGT